MNKILIWFQSSFLGNQYLQLRMTTPKTDVFGQLRHHMLSVCSKTNLRLPYAIESMSNGPTKTVFETQRSKDKNWET